MVVNQSVQAVPLRHRPDRSLPECYCDRVGDYDSPIRNWSVGTFRTWGAKCAEFVRHQYGFYVITSETRSFPELFGSFALGAWVPQFVGLVAGAPACRTFLEFWHRFAPYV